MSGRHGGWDGSWTVSWWDRNLAGVTVTEDPRVGPSRVGSATVGGAFQRGAGILVLTRQKPRVLRVRTMVGSVVFVPWVYFSDLAHSSCGYRAILFQTSRSNPQDPSSTARPFPCLGSHVR